MDGKIPLILLQPLEHWTAVQTNSRLEYCNIACFAHLWFFCESHLSTRLFIFFQFVQFFRLFSIFEPPMFSTLLVLPTITHKCRILTILQLIAIEA